MSNLNITFDPSKAFADPVDYLALFGIDAELISDLNEGDLPLAA